jgi:hypothetical protein
VGGAVHLCRRDVCKDVLATILADIDLDDAFPFEAREVRNDATPLAVAAARQVFLRRHGETDDVVYSHEARLGVARLSLCGEVVKVIDCRHGPEEPAEGRGGVRDGVEGIDRGNEAVVEARHSEGLHPPEGRVEGEHHRVVRCAGEGVTVCLSHVIIASPKVGPRTTTARACCRFLAHDASAACRGVRS